MAFAKAIPLGKNFIYTLDKQAIKCVVWFPNLLSNMCPNFSTWRIKPKYKYTVYLYNKLTTTGKV